MLALRKLLRANSLCGCILVCGVLYAVAADKKDQSPCAKPRELSSKPQLSKEEQKRAHEIRAQGMVAISINEEGDVVDAKILRASSADAVGFLLAQARSMKFKPRPACGVTYTKVNFTFSGD
jgi:hypothetical protein